MDVKAWHQLSPEEALRKLESDASRGISSETARRRLERDGPNELRAAARVSGLSIFISQFKNVLIVILIAATVLSFFLGHQMEAAAIAAIVSFAVLLGFFQEYRAEHAMEALRRMTATTATVLRDGSESEIPARKLAAGDVVLLSSGNKVPADARLIEAVNLRVEESALTGESAPVEKNTLPLEDASLGVADRANMVWSGTLVAYGRGKAVVTETGMNTEFGRITGSLGAVKTPQTPLQRNLDRIGKILAAAALVIVALIVGLGLLRGEPLLEMLIFGIALAVAVVPEALPAVVTISLAIGVQRMARCHALARHLPVVETLGCTTTICSDKTGTLTKDQMTVRKIFTGERLIDVEGSGYAPDGEFRHNSQKISPDDRILSLLRAGWLCSDAHLERKDGVWTLKGDPTEGALIAAAMKAGLKKEEIESAFPRTDEIPFSSETKRMTTIHDSAEGKIAFSKGAPEVIIKDCSFPDEAKREELLAEAHKMAEGALRVLAVACKKDPGRGEAQRGMIFLGIVGMIDPPRPEAQSAVKTCEQAGIRPVMITGDHPLTAQAVAAELGILKNSRVITGAELESMDQEALERSVAEVEVYARVSPEHKLRIVQAMQKNGEIVAMTGDGVNDAPALKKADIGIAMGITGTDAAKEVAAMTLADDNFASIVAAVEEGRHIFNNIKKYLMFLLSSNIGEIGLMTGAVLLGLPLPLTAVQILYVNLATDGFPALALAVDPPDPKLMGRAPRDPKRGIFTGRVIALILVGGAWSALVNLGIFMWAFEAEHIDLKEAMTISFLSLIFMQFLKAYNYRSDHESILKGIFSNKWLNIAIAGETLLLIAIVNVPALQAAFGTSGISPREWAAALAASLTIVPVLEAAKWVIRRRMVSKKELVE